MNNWIISLFALSLMVSCKPKDENVATSGINELAQQYVRLALVIGQYDEPFVDASVSYTHLRAHETVLDLVCRLLLETKKRK